MNLRTISIADLARAAGVSHSTVSRALRNSPLISSEVRERIQRLADELGYTPNGIAQSLQTRRTDTIGLVVTSVADPFFADVVKGVEEVARPAGLSVFLSASHNDPHEEVRAIETFHRRRVDGMLIADSRIGATYMQRFKRLNVPTVLINAQTEEPHDLIHSVMVDDRGGAAAAVTHLLQLGHRAIGYMGVGNRPLSNQRRLAGYRDALAAAGLAYDPQWVVIAPEADTLHEDDVAAGHALLHPLLHAGVTAVFCYNDMLAVGAMMACRAAGPSVPDALSVVGFDDVAVARYITPPLTTVHQPKIEMGRHAMRMLLALLGGQPVESAVLVPTLVPRASAAAPRTISTEGES